MVDLPQYPGYGIEPDGRVWSYKRNKYLAQRQDKNTGYYMVWMYINGKQKAETIHRLIALAYIPNPENKKYIDHIDRDRTNNSIENLRWVTAKENCSNAKTYKGGNRKENCKRYYENNKDTILEKQKTKYRETHPEKIKITKKESQHNWYLKNKNKPEYKEKQKKYKKEYRKREKEKRLKEEL